MAAPPRTLHGIPGGLKEVVVSSVQLEPLRDHV
jgi:hypothetical protein